MATNHQRPRYIPVTEIVEIVYCEQKAVFNWRYGDQPTEDQQARRELGDRLHFEFAAEANQAASRRPCWIATHVYGAHAWETDALRSFRDQVLDVSWIGRSFVATYYCLAPGIVWVLLRAPVLKLVARWLLDRLVARIHRSGAAGYRNR
jgi:hypothetical protein